MPEGTEQEVATAEAESKKAETGLDKLDAETRSFVLDLRKENEKLRKKYEAKIKEEESKHAKELEEQGQFKSLYEKLKAEMDPLKSLAEKYEAAEADRKKKLLSRLPESKREQYSQVPTDVLEDMVNELTKDKPTAARKAGESKGSKKLSEMSTEEQMDLKSSSPSAWATQFKQEYREVNGCDPPPFMLR